MASSTTSSGVENENLQGLIDQRKRKRMVSNRESARRSRMKKQQHLDDLMSQLSQLRQENNKIMGNVSIAMQHYTSVEAENLVLKAQVAELSHRLESLNQIIAFMNQPIAVAEEQYYQYGTELVDEFMNNSLTCFYANQPAVLASTDMIHY